MDQKELTEHFFLEVKGEFWELTRKISLYFYETFPNPVVKINELLLNFCWVLNNVEQYHVVSS